MGVEWEHIEPVADGGRWDNVREAPTERDKTAAALLRTTPEAVRDLRVHRADSDPPVGPDCVAGKHDVCAGEALDETTDTIVPCSCCATHVRTRTGRVLAEADFKALADEAERGYEDRL